MINISEGEMEIVMGILNAYVPKDKVLCFGSRIANNYRKYSDLDIVIKSKEEIPLSKLSELEEAFQEADLPFRVDVVDWNRISDEFKKIIEKSYKVLK